MLPEIQKTDIERNLCVRNKAKLIDVMNGVANGANTWMSSGSRPGPKNGNEVANARHVGLSVEQLNDQGWIQNAPFVACV